MEVRQGGEVILQRLACKASGQSRLGPRSSGRREMRGGPDPSALELRILLCGV